MCSSSCARSLKKPLNADLARDILNVEGGSPLVLGLHCLYRQIQTFDQVQAVIYKVNYVPDSKTHDECSDDLDHAEPLLVAKKTDRLGTLLSHVPERLCHTMQQISRLIVLSRKFEESEVGF